MLNSITMSDTENSQNKDETKTEEPKVELNLDTLLLDLKIISNIKEFDKISIKDNIEIDSPHLLQSINRKLNGDGRDKTIKYINNVIKNIFTILDDILNKEMKTEVITSQNYYTRNEKYVFNKDTIATYQTISQNLTESISGLQNLKITYLNDITTTSKIDMLIIKIQNRISKINSMMIIDPDN